MSLQKTVSCNNVYSLLNLYGFDFDLLVQCGAVIAMSMLWSYSIHIYSMLNF